MDLASNYGFSAENTHLKKDEIKKKFIVAYERVQLVGFLYTYRKYTHFNFKRYFLLLL